MVVFTTLFFTLVLRCLVSCPTSVFGVCSSVEAVLLCSTDLPFYFGVLTTVFSKHKIVGSDGDGLACVRSVHWSRLLTKSETAVHGVELCSG